MPPLRFLTPELVLLASLLLILLLDLFVQEKRWLGILLLIVFLYDGVLLSLQLSSGSFPQVIAFEGHLLFVNDGVSIILKIGALLTGIFVLLSAFPFLEKLEYKGELFLFLNAVILAILLLCSAVDWILIYLSLEFTSLVSYILVGFRRDARSTEAAIKYFLLGAVCSAFMVFGLALVYGVSGTTSLAEMTASSAPALLLAFLLIFAGFGFKIAAFPFHMWAPDAYEGAPTFVTAFLSVGPKMGAFAVLLRATILGFPALRAEWLPFLTVSAIFSMTLGNVVALHQKNIKRMLAYSTIAHMGYVMVGLISVQGAMRGDLGVQSVLAYLLIYLFMNLGLFAAVQAIEEKLKTEAIPQYAGLSQRHPLLSLFMAIFLLSLTGIPPFAGFVGKFWIFSAAIQAKYFALALVMGVNSVVAAYYYLNVVRVIYLVPAQSRRSFTISPPLLFCILLGALGTVLLGLFPSLLYVLLNSAALFSG